MITRLPHGAAHKIRWTDATGAEWTIWDATFSGGKHHRLTPPSSRATSRIFVPAEGVKRTYRFTPGENRQLTDTALEAQLRQASYLPTESFDVSSRGDPR